VTVSRPHSQFPWLRGRYRAVAGPWNQIGVQTKFYGRTLRSIVYAITNYRIELFRIIAQMGLGAGALIMIGGTVAIVGFLTVTTGALVAVQGYTDFSEIGVEALTGFASAFFNVRLIAPATTAVALSATIGAGATAQLGAMRISEEIDALEVMAVPSLPYLVTTRIIAGLIAIVPLYVVGLLSSYFATRLVVTQFFGQSPGTYDHYFNQFLPPGDVLWSFGKVLVFAVVVVMIHCYHGYTATGGPAGVGVAVGRAVRTSIVAINVIDLFLSMAIWGANTTVRLAG